MKRVLLIVLLSFLCAGTFAQHMKVTRVSLFGGAGLATSNNYDVGLSYGLDFDRSIGGRMQLGALLFLQGYSLYSDKEAGGESHGHGEAGMTVRHNSSYAFFSPTLKYVFRAKRGYTSWVGVTAGAGFNMSGYDSVHKWDHSFNNPSVGNYDSVIDASANINKMVYRFGVFFMQDMYTRRGNWWFTFREDFGILYNGLTKTAEVTSTSPSRTPYSPDKFNPGYISLQVGISYLKFKRR